MMLETHKRKKVNTRILHDLIFLPVLRTYSTEEAGNYMRMLTENKVIYRLKLSDSTKSVDVDWYDLQENFAPELKRVYDSVHELPQWVQEKLSVLMVLDPTKINHDIDGVGRRINKDIFWVFKENTHGHHTRGQGQEGGSSNTG